MKKTLSLLFLMLFVFSAQAQTDYNIHGTLPDGLDCENCHATDAWIPVLDEMDFDHNSKTAFPLTGSHTLTDCASCHLDLVFEEPKTGVDECASCHLDIHQGAYANTCSNCHNTQRFEDIEGMVVHEQTRFPLIGVHAQITCESCHFDDAKGSFTPLETECASCHQSNYDNTLTHKDGNYPLDCESCHFEFNWLDADFDHTEASGGYVLLGAHDGASCQSCHQPPGLSLIFTPASNEDCITCHQADYDHEHAGSGFPTNCLACHNVRTFDDPDNFVHADAANGFDLLGAHAAAACSGCHNADNSLKFSPANDQDCISCHQADYDEEHAGSGFPTTCLTCHNVDSFDDADDFVHADVANGFDLLGAHNTGNCAACHNADNSLKFTPTNDQDCISCHQADYDNEHSGSGFPTTCLTCHNVNSFDDADDFVHADVANGFDLLGAHNTGNCAACHNADNSLKFAPANDQDCATCHQTDYDAQHAGTGFPDDCTVCHTTNSFEDPTAFDHGSAANGFDLLGAHETAACTSCHNADNSLIFAPANDQDCISCHQTDYDANHTGSGFPTTCLTCHTDDTFGNPTPFDHGVVSNGFELIGAHTNSDCSTCHNADNSLIFFPTDDQDCISCHQMDYDNEHSGSGFPTTCLTCHTTDSFDNPTPFDHASVSAGFELIGAHTNSDCSSCHNADNSLIFMPADNQDCITCHQTDYDSNHTGSGFPTTCLTCHNIDSFGDPTPFDHATVSGGFELIGAHTNSDCSTCHNADNSLIFTPADNQDCITCHQADYDGEHAGDGFPTTCLACHTTDSFGNANFNHDADYFRIYSGDHKDEWGSDCANCHTNPNDFTVFSCTNCHEQTETNNDHSEVSGYTYESNACYSCHPRV